MSGAEVYGSSSIKRYRATKAEVKRRRSDLFEIVSQLHPMTVRQAFYQASVRGIVDKSETGYDKVQNDLVLMRRAAICPMGGSSTALDGSASRGPSPVSPTPSGKLPSFIGRRSGMTSINMSKSGSKKMRWLESSIR